MWEKLMMTEIDGKGRVLIPKTMRERVGLLGGTKVRIRVAGGAVVLEPVRSVADENFGAFRVTKWPRDLDKHLSDVQRARWASKDT